MKIELASYQMVIHEIMVFMDTRSAVQTSILSKRWKLVWTTLPYLNFNANDQHYKDFSSFLDHFFSCRNCESRVMKLDFCPGKGLHVRVMKKYVNYANSHNLESLHVILDRGCSLSTFSSNSLKELTLAMKFESRTLVKSHCWTLPNLATLLLKNCLNNKYLKVPESFFTCLPALRTLGLDLFELPEFFSLPALTTLRVKSCILPQQVWNLPALLTLELTNVVFPDHISDYFLALISLRDLAIDFDGHSIGCCVISSLLLLNLKIRVSYFTLNLTKGKVVVLAPKLRNFHAIGVFLTRFECSELENVTIQFWDCKFSTPWWTLKQYKDLFKVMFSQLGSTKILTLDSATLQALSEIRKVLVHGCCPFYNLKYLKLPPGYDKSSTFRHVIRYLLSGSPSATIVKTLSPDDLTPPMTSAAPLVTQHGVRSRRLKNIVENNVVNSHKVRQIEAPVAGASNGQVNAMEKSNFVLWQGHEVASEFVGVLDLIMKKYPKTFRNLPKKNEKILTVKLNTFCSLVNTFTKMSMTEVNTEMLAEFGSLFTDLHKWGFNINWLVRHLNYIKKLHELHATDSRIDIAKIKLQEKLTQCAEKLNGSESFQTTGTSHAAMPSFIGNGLL
ncbi:uncharacterized protein LOC141678892 [Apium graveolens]|uniref:uncharacterized protein LOC141678892 n=1 Tax=Apium graveolens TaxID=4045 RepID=UPI003D7BD4E1